MNTYISKLQKLSLIGISVLVSGLSPSHASLLQLEHEPLFLNQTVPPAISVTLDDSGSMAWTYMGANDSNGFVDPNLNRLYYNPNITYAPPLRADGSSFPDSNPLSAWVDGYPNDMNATVNLTTNYIAMGNFSYSRTGNDVTINFKDTRRYNARSGSWTNQYPTGWGCNNGCTGGTRAYYYLGNTRYDVTNTTDLQNFANWYSYYNSRAKLSKAAISRSFASFSPSFKIAWQELNRNSAFNNLAKFETGHRANFFTWLFGAPTSGGTPLRASFKRAGELFEQDSSYTSPDYPGLLSCQQNFHIAISDGGWNGGLSGTFQQDDTSQGISGDTGTPENSNTPLYASMGYTGTGAQKIYNYAQDNYLADVAFDSWIRDLRPNIPNYVPRYKKDYTDHDGAALTFTGLADEWESPEFVWNPKNDPAYWQHLVTYNVGMGLNASRVENHANGNTTTCNTVGVADSKDSVYQSLRANSPTSCVWPNNVIDDVWHSSINSRGDFFSANDPTELINALNEVVTNIIERTARGSTSTVTSGVVTDDTLAYSPSFDSSSWSGTLVARTVNDNGTFNDVEWDANCVLTGGHCDSIGGTVPQQSTRYLYAYDKSTDSVVPFDTSLPATLKSQIQLSALDYAGSIFGTVITAGDVNNIIEYVAGDRSNETANGGTFRDRKGLMADIINSTPTIVRGPGEFYDDLYWPDNSTENSNPYLDFKIAQKDRKNMVYIGANGGMLHAFETAEDGSGAEERWAFMPSEAVPNIHHLPSNKHHSFVNANTVVRDVFINGSWRTILIGGMRYGGQGFYALDITNAASRQPTVLWEFTDEDDADLGFTYGEAEIVRLSSTGEWVALLPNGYNNSEKDHTNLGDPRNILSLTGTSVLYVVRLSDGQLIKKFDSGVGAATTPNGMASPVAVDSEYYGAPGQPIGLDLGADYAYAGDLYGNLWKFDLSSPNPGSWSMSAVVSAGSAPDVLPITVKPRVIAVPDAQQSKENDVIVIYGTGKYIETPDRDTNIGDQYLVGLVDGLESTNTNLNISDPSFIEQSFGGGGRYRTLTNREVNLSVQNGWKIKLPEQGERIFNPLALFGTELLIATSNITAGIDPCLPGGRSWLLAIDPLTGGTPTLDGEIQHIFENITVTVGGTPTTISGSGTGVLVNDFIIGKPPILEQQGTGSTTLLIEGSENTEQISLTKFTWRRRNWTNILTQ